LISTGTGDSSQDPSGAGVADVFEPVIGHLAWMVWESGNPSQKSKEEDGTSENAGRESDSIADEETN